MHDWLYSSGYFGKRLNIVLYVGILGESVKLCG